MTLISVTCYNEDCPSFERHEDGTVTGEQYFGTSVAASRTDPGYIEGTCPKCGEEVSEYDEVETMSQYDIDAMKADMQEDYN